MVEVGGLECLKPRFANALEEQEGVPADAEAMVLETCRCALPLLIAVGECHDLQNMQD